MSFDALQERLATLQETTTQVRGLIDRLSKLDFQPGSVPLPQGNNNDDDDDNDDENVATELSGEINQILREEEEDLELLAEEVADLRGGKEGSEAEKRKSRLREGVTRLVDDVKSARIAFHKAQLTARRSLEAARRLERQLLLQSYASRAATNTTTTPQSRSGANSPAPSFNPARRRQGTHNSHKARESSDPVVSASSDLTRSLHRARQLVQDELARSMTLHETLQDSTTQLKQLGGTYGRMEDMLASSKDLLGTLMKSTKSDTWYLQTTFYMLVAVLGWLIFRRWFYGPLWWLVWLPLRVVFKTGTGAVGLVGGGSGGDSSSVGVGTGARMEVVDGGGRRIEVDMGQEGVVPTAKVGKEQERTNGWGDRDSMVEQIGRIIDGEAGQPDETGQDVPVVSEGDDGRVRDEL